MKIGCRARNEPGQFVTIAGQGVQVPADAEVAAFGVDENAADRGIDGAFGRQFVEFASKLAIERIAALGLIERDMRDAAFDLESERVSFIFRVPSPDREAAAPHSAFAESRDCVRRFITSSRVSRSA